MTKKDSKILQYQKLYSLERKSLFSFMTVICTNNILKQKINIYKNKMKSI